MSFEEIVHYYIECDNCSDTEDDIDEDIQYLEKQLERNGGSLGLDIDGNWYEHLCETCQSSTTYCEWCEEDTFTEGSYNCQTFNIPTEHEECLQNVHHEDGASIEWDHFECTECSWIDNVALEAYKAAHPKRKILV